MAEWSTRGGGQYFDTLGEVAASSRGTALLGGGNNVKGAYVELSTATPLQADGLIVMLGRGGGCNDSLTDLAIGAAGSEQIIAANLSASPAPFSSYYSSAGTAYYLPLSIPEGERLAARTQSLGTTLRIAVTLVALGGLASKPFNGAATYGAVTADSGGTSIDPGGTAHTKGAYVELTAATSADMRELILALGNAGISRGYAADWLLDIGIGAAGSEQVLLPDLPLCTGSGTISMGILPQTIGPLPCNIPAGTRIAARAQCSINTASDRIFDLILYGVG